MVKQFYGSHNEINLKFFVQKKQLVKLMKIKKMGYKHSLFSTNNIKS